MSDLQAFVDHIQSQIAGIGPADVCVKGREWPPDVAVLIKLSLDDLSHRFLNVLGKERVEKFFKDVEPNSVDASSHLIIPLSRMIPACCQFLPGGKVSLDSGQLLGELTRIADCVTAGELLYSISFRITNIDITSAFELADGIHFHKASPEVIEQKYPLEGRSSPLSHFVAVSPFVAENWLKHCVEIQIVRRGKPSDVQQCQRIEQMEGMVNSILHAFLISDIPDNAKPFVTHIILDSPIESSCHYRGNGSVSSKPRLLTMNDVGIVQQCYALLKAIECDRVLQTAADRFIIGRKRELHHPNRINQPHWDKIVDYVIAMETLFLTVNGNGIPQELSYRFSLNGASLIHRSMGEDVRQTFHALKCLYELRSKVVHGCGDSAILKPANDFIRQVGIDSSHHQHSLGRLTLIAKKLDQWLRGLLTHLESLPSHERPFRKADGWEEMLWQIPAR